MLIVNFAQYTLILALRFYRYVLSPAKAAFFGPRDHCRYQPSCSAYALEAVQRHGAWRGSGLAIARIGRCHPWGGCGSDPVPPIADAFPIPGRATRPNA